MVKIQLVAAAFVQFSRDQKL